MSTQVLDPATRNVLAVMGRALIALAAGELDEAFLVKAGDLSLADARTILHAHNEDGRRVGPRRCYSIVKKGLNAAALKKFPPATRQIITSLAGKAKQTKPDLIAYTGLRRKTVENSLTALNAKGFLLIEDLATC